MIRTWHDLADAHRKISQRLQPWRAAWQRKTPTERLTWVSRHLPSRISLLLVLVIGYDLARLVWLLIPAPPPPDWRPPPRDAAALTSGNGAPGDYQAIVATIVAAHLFGEVAVEPPAPQTPVDAPPTELQLELRGVVASSDVALAHAIIGAAGGAEQVYFLGSEVSGGATVFQIQPDRVILRRDGVLEALLLPRAVDIDPLTDGPSITLGAAATADEDSVAAAQPPPVITPRPATVGDVLMHRPVIKAGQLRGYQVFPGEHRARFEALGLEPGDVITAIDGAPLRAESEAVFQTLAARMDLTVTVDRRGRSRTLQLTGGKNKTL